MHTYLYKICRYRAKIFPGTRTPSLRRDMFEDDLSFDLSEDMIEFLSVGIVIDFPQRTIYQRINWLWTLKCVFCGFYIPMGILKEVFLSKSTSENTRKKAKILQADFLAFCQYIISAQIVSQVMKF